jgi:hypothetical protein
MSFNDNENSVNVANGAGGSLRFEQTVASEPAVIAVNGDASNNFFNGITLASPLHLFINDDNDNGVGGSVQITGAISQATPGQSVKVVGRSLRGAALTLSAANTYSDGITTDGALLNLSNAAAQGTGAATATNGGAISLGFTPTASHIYNIEPWSAIAGTSARLAALDANANLNAATNSIIGVQQNASALPANIDRTKLYLGVFTTNLADSLTVGSQSGSWRGFYGGSGFDSIASGPISIVGDATVGSLGGRQLNVTGNVTGGTAADTITVREGQLRSCASRHGKRPPDHRWDANAKRAAES